MNCRILIPSNQRLQIPDIKREFVGFLSDMNEEITLDSIDLLEGKRGFKIRSHNADAVLPDIIVPETENRYEILDRLDTEIARLVDTAHTRRNSTTPVAPVFAIPNAGGVPLHPKASRITMLIGKRFTSLHRQEV
jgi:hypothetical protein